MIAFGLSDRTHDATAGLPAWGLHSQRSAPAWLAAVLRVPLELKLLGANLAIMLAAAAILYANSGLEPTRVADALIIITAFVLAPLVNIALVRLALRPLKSLTRVAWLVSQGLLGARVPASIMADRELTQLSHTINKLLDDIVEQRDRLDHASEWCTDVTRR